MNNERKVYYIDVGDMPFDKAKNLIDSMISEQTGKPIKETKIPGFIEVMAYGALWANV